MRSKERKAKSRYLYDLIHLFPIFPEFLEMMSIGTQELPFSNVP